MNILIVSFTFPPNKDGVSEAAGAMAAGFVERGWHVTVLTEESQPPRSCSTWDGIRIVPYANVHEPKAGIELLDSGSTLVDFLISGKWDVIMIHAYTHPLKVILPFLDRIPSKMILVSHGYAPFIWEGNGIFPSGLRSWCRRVLRSFSMFSWISKFDRVVYLSEQADMGGFYDHLIAKVAGYSGRTVIPNGVDPEVMGENPADFRERHGIPDDAFMFLCVANYSPRKAQGYAARAFRKAAIPGSFLVFIGSEFNEHSRNFQADDAANAGRGCGSIIWLEKQDRRTTLDALAACDAFLLSSYHEAQPIALLEAMREGKPWIARKAGCIERMEGGICVNSEYEMTAAMVRLSSDPALQTRLGQQGKTAVTTRYNRAKYVESYCKLVEELVPSV